MNTDRQKMSRRERLMQGGVSLAGLALLNSPLLAQAFPSRAGEQVLSWLDQPPANPAPAVVGNLQRWEEPLSSWLTPNDKFFSVGHYNKPVIDEQAWALEITGLVKRPMTLTLRNLKARPRQEVIFTLECSGNHGLPGFSAGIGTAKWAGTPLAPLPGAAGVLDRGIEVRDTRYIGRFMARDYVTIREEQLDGETVWMETSVGRALLKSVPAKVTRQNDQYHIIGAAWGAPIQRVEVQIDGGRWMPATINRHDEAGFALSVSEERCLPRSAIRSRVSL